MNLKCNIYENADVRVEEAAPVAATEGNCRFAVKACGICGSDIPRVFANGAYFYPIVLGHEFAGIVTDSTDKAKIGRRACVFPILPCGKCDACAREDWASCAQYGYYGSRRDGGMQSELLIKEENLIYLPDGVSYEAGAMIEPMAVCLHAMKKASIKQGDVVAIWGAGAIGLICGMWARSMGASRVLFFDPDARRMAFAGELGFEALADETADVCVDASGASPALNAAIAHTRAQGRVVLVGNAHGDMTIDKATYSTLLRRQLTLVGSWNSDHKSDVDDWRESVEAIADGRIAPEALITHRFELERADAAFRLIGERCEFYNKIMVVM